MVMLTGSVISAARIPATAGNTAGLPVSAAPGAADQVPARSGTVVSGQQLVVPARAGTSTSGAPVLPERLPAETLSLSAVRALSVFAQVAASTDDYHGQAELAGIDIVV